MNKSRLPRKKKKAIRKAAAKAYAQCNYIWVGGFTVDEFAYN